MPMKPSNIQNNMYMVIKTTIIITTEFQPEIVIFVWCSSALAKYMAGVNIETFPICTFTVQIDKQASIAPIKRNCKKIILFYYSSI